MFLILLFLGIIMGQSFRVYIQRIVTVSIYQVLRQVKTGSYTIAIPDSYAMQLEWWTVLALYTDELGNSGIHIASDVIDVGNLWEDVFTDTNYSYEDLKTNMENWYSTESSTYIRNFAFDNLFLVHGAEGDAYLNAYNFTEAKLGGTTEVNIVPIPAAGWLLVSGMVGLIGVRRFRR